MISCYDIMTEFLNLNTESLRLPLDHVATSAIYSFQPYTHAVTSIPYLNPTVLASMTLTTPVNGNRGYRAESCLLLDTIALGK